MRQIFEEVNKEMMERFSGIDIFLTTIWAEAVFDNVVAIQAGFIDSSMTMSHKKTI